MNRKKTSPKPLVSIVTINLNNNAGLTRTLESIAPQTWQNFESIIVDGASTDGSVETIREFEKSKRFTIGKWVSEKDKGLYNAMNKGIRFSRGKYLLFLNSGDYLATNDVLEKLQPKKWKTDLVYGNMLVQQNGKDILFRSPKEISLFYLAFAAMLHPATFVRRQLFDSVGFYREDLRIASDHFFFVKAFCHHGPTTQYQDIVISVFEGGGISNKTQYSSLQTAERRQVLRELLPPENLEYLELHYDLVDRLNSFRFALLALPRYFWRLARKFIYRLRS